MRAYAVFAGLEDTVLTELLGFSAEGQGEYLLSGSERKFRLAYDAPPAWHDQQGAGSVENAGSCATGQRQFEAAVGRDVLDLKVNANRGGC